MPRLQESAPFQGSYGQPRETTPVRTSLSSYFRPTKFKTHYVSPQFFIFFNRPSKLCQTSFIEMRAYFSFGLILWDIPNSIAPETTLHLLPIPVGLLVLPCAGDPPPPFSHSPFFFLSRTEEAAKGGTCAHDRRALQQLALNVHVKHSDLT